MKEYDAVAKRYSFNHIPTLILYDAHVKSVIRTGLVSLVTGGISLFAFRIISGVAGGNQARNG